MLPQWDFEIDINDQILFACDDNAKNDIEDIVNNMYEFHYIITGEENKSFRNFVSKLISKKEI